MRELEYIQKAMNELDVKKERENSTEYEDRAYDLLISAYDIIKVGRNLSNNKEVQKCMSENK